MVGEGLLRISGANSLEGPAGLWWTRSSFLPKVNFAPTLATSSVVELRFRISGKLNLRTEIGRFGPAMGVGAGLLVLDLPAAWFHPIQSESGSGLRVQGLI